MSRRLPDADWPFLRAGLIGSGLLVVAALLVWGVETARYEDRAFERTTRCLVEEQGVAVVESADPIARSAARGALDLVVETNPVTVAVAADRAGAEQVADRYRSVADALGDRLEVRGRTVYLWGRSPSPTQRQTLYDCTA